MKILRYCVILLATMVCGRIFAQDNLKQLMRERGEYYFSLNVQKPAEIQALSALCSVDGTDGQTVVCYANQNEYENLLKQGYQPALLTPPSMREQPRMWDGNDRTAYDWDTYPTYGQYEAMMQQFATDHPDRCTYIELGTLSSGRKLMVCRINNGQPDGKPKFLYTSTMHGDEVTGMMLMLRLIDELCTSTDDRIMNLVNNLDIFISPNTNPDGTYHGGNNTVYGATRANGNNIDLNRHYPDFDKGPHPDGQSYYQDETVWLMDLAQEYLFTMSANYHGGAEVMNYPWDTYQPFHPDDDWWKLVCHEYADLAHEQNANYMTDYNDGITNGYAWYTISGSRQDYMNYYAQCREVTIECSNSKTPSASQMPTFWNYNHNSMLTYMEESLKGVHGVVTDSITGEPIVGADITVSGHDHHGSSVTTHSTGDFHRPIKGGNWTFVINKDGYCPKIVDVTLADGETVNLDVQLVPGSCMVADFSASTTEVTVGHSVNFTDHSFGDIVSWQWEFEGATPSTSTQQNPTNIAYNTIGDYSVSLTITDADNNSVTMTRNDYIHVREAYNMQNGTVETCNALFYDSGGNMNYGNNESYTMTFRPDGEGRKIKVTFADFNLESGYDYLYVFDGPASSSPEIGRYSGSTIPGPFEATNDEGALTFRFTSDGGVTASGWIAAVQCLVPYEPMMIGVNADPMEVNEGGSSQLEAIVMGGAGDYTYLWEPAETLDDPTICCPVATPVEPETTYRVTVTDALGYTALGEVTITIKNWSLPEDSRASFVYPNPNKGTFTVNAAGDFSYQLFNSVGQRVLAGTANGTTEIHAEGLAKGLYFLQLTQDGNRFEKIVIE